MSDKNTRNIYYPEYIDNPILPEITRLEIQLNDKYFNEYTATPQEIINNLLIIDDGITPNRKKINKKSKHK